MVIHACALAMVFSKSLESRRQRPSHAPLDGLRVRSTLDDPAPGQNLEALGAVGALDDFGDPLPDLLQGSLELGAGIGGVGENSTPPGGISYVWTLTCVDGSRHRHLDVPKRDCFMNR